jgi:hypothetical protein
MEAGELSTTFDKALRDNPLDFTIKKKRLESAKA